MTSAAGGLPGLPGVNTVLWDLDGTLVGIRRRTFAALMPAVAAAMFADIVAPWRFARILAAVLPDVRANTTELTNFDLMVTRIADETGRDPELIGARLSRLAERGFPRLRRCFYPHRAAGALVEALAARNLSQVVATNPLWPLSTAHARLGWGGIDARRFSFIASGSSMRTAKPRLDYYRELLQILQCQPHECIMIGNDATADTPAAELGIPVHLLNNSYPARSELAASPLVTVGDWAVLAARLGVSPLPGSDLSSGTV